MSVKSVKVPKEMEPIFKKAEEYVQGFFNDEKKIPEKGSILIGGQRYILVRATSMSVEFLEFIKQKYPSFDEGEAYDASSKLLFDLSHSIGKSDAKNFHKKMGVTEPIAKLSSGPIHFAYAGWAFVDIFSESKPTPDENFYLIYDHPQSFEADSWIESKKNTNKPTCFMNAGYSSGWCEESFGINLTAKEILCRARGDPFCRFIMASPSKIDEFIQKYKTKNPRLFKNEQ